MNIGHTAKDYSILFVDDEEKTLKYFSRYFSKDFTVLTATNTSDARAILDEKAAEIGLLISAQRMLEREISQYCQIADHCLFRPGRCDRSGKPGRDNALHTQTLGYKLSGTGNTACHAFLPDQCREGAIKE